MTKQSANTEGYVLHLPVLSFNTTVLCVGFSNIENLEQEKKDLVKNVGSYFSCGWTGRLPVSSFNDVCLPIVLSPFPNICKCGR